MTDPTVLDGLAWAQVAEKDRVARISAILVRNLGPHEGGYLTKTSVKEEIKKTFPPYGRGKAIFEAVELEYRRQHRIWCKREVDRIKWENYLRDQARIDTRRNNAYAHAFGRPRLSPEVPWPGEYSYPQSDARKEWEAAEEARDKGDKCDALTHQGEYTVALATGREEDQPFIAVRRKRGEIARTYLDEKYDGCDTLVKAAVSLGGPKVVAALAKGKRVHTDWVGRRTLIYHDGCDFEYVHVEEIPWNAAVMGINSIGHHERIPITILGDRVL